MLEQKVKAAWSAFIAANDPSADVSERAWEDLHFTERNAWFSAFNAFVVPTDEQQSVQQDHYKELAALGWQAIECPVCGSSAQAYPRQAAQPQPSPISVLLAVEESIKNGECPWQIEQAFEEYESQRQATITKGTT